MRVVFVIIGAILLIIISLLIIPRIITARGMQEAKPYVTYTRLIYVASWCDKYKGQYGAWPSSLAQLRAFRPELIDWARDAWGPGDNMWGRDVVLISYNETIGYGEVISYGRDGMPGGTSVDQDMVVRFPLTTNSNRNEHVEHSLKKPERLQ